MDIELAVIGGSGLYRLLDDAEMIEVDTPYGPPSAPVAIGRVHGAAGEREVAFLARHGLEHQWPPHRVNYRANVWALHSLGVQRIVAPCACGSLRVELKPGEVVLCDQYVDATWGRPGTFFDGPQVNHLAAAEPYCADLTGAMGPQLVAGGFQVHPRGTVVVIAGPRFATRAESATYRTLGYDVVNMTQCPEVALARELGLCYCAVALITDYDSGLEAQPELAAVTQADVFAAFAANVDRLRSVLHGALAALPPGRSCACADNGFG
jgi:5'-methylthioadenosine phosphorylase